MVARASRLIVTLARRVSAVVFFGELESRVIVPVDVLGRSLTLCFGS
jgi:hypothetical protein